MELTEKVNATLGSALDLACTAQRLLVRATIKAKWRAEGAEGLWDPVSHQLDLRVGC